MENGRQRVLKSIKFQKESCIPHSGYVIDLQEIVLKLTQELLDQALLNEKEK